MFDFNPLGVVNTAWAFATVCQTEAALFELLAKETKRHVFDFHPQGLANAAWAFATADHTDVTLFGSLARAAERCISDFTGLERKLAGGH